VLALGLIKNALRRGDGCLLSFALPCPSFLFFVALTQAFLLLLFKSHRSLA
jgi:hypothetical protein